MKEGSIGIDLGGTRIKIGVVADGEVIAKTIVPAQSANGLKAHLPVLKEAVDKLVMEAGLASPKGIGLAFPGLVDPRAQKILSTNQKYDDALDLDMAAWVQEAWGVPFLLDNDARMAAVGEWKYGAGRDTENLVVMTIGTGIGTSAILEGKLLRGKHFQAGCLGGHFTVQYHGRRCTCGNIGCVEAHGSTWSLPLDLAERGTSDIKDFATLFEEAKKGNTLAVSLQQDYLDVWAAGIINLIHAYDPEVVVLGGGVLNSADTIIPYITRRVHQYAWCPWGKVKIRPTQLLSNAGILGVVHCLHHPV